MAKTQLSPEKTVIDPRFDVPDGLDSFVYPTESTVPEFVITNSEYSDVVITYPDELSVEETESGEVTSNAPAVPQQFSVISQTIHMSPDGRQLVDVEIQVEDIDGVDHIDFRVTKA